MNKYSVPWITYDLRGNIQSLARIGVDSMCEDTSTLYHYEMIDDLVYDYRDNSNQVYWITDYVEPVASNKRGFNIESGMGEAGYSYDDMGNVVSDGRSGYGITYNAFNLPSDIDGYQVLYDGDGIKRYQEDPEAIWLYADGIEYKDYELNGVYFEDGRYVRDEASETGWRKEIYFRDHLGSVRVVASDLDHDGTIEADTADNYADWEIISVYNYLNFRHLGE